MLRSTVLAWALLFLSMAVSPSEAHAAACTLKEANRTVAAYQRAEKALDRCLKTIDGDGSHSAMCRDCRKARDSLRVANRRAKSMVASCGAAGDTAGARELQDATHLIDQANYQISQALRQYCPGG